MLPEIASLHERMAQGGDWMNWREKIADLHQRATTQDEYVVLLRAHSILGRLIDEVYDEQAAEKIRPIHSGEYKLFLNKEAMGNGELINPAILDMITGLVTILRRSPERLELAEGDRRDDEVFRRV